MADNFLERRMEDYRSGRLKPRLKPVAPREAVFIAAPAANEALRRVIAEQRALGRAVSFWTAKPAGSQALAYSSGAMYHPFPTAGEALNDCRRRRDPMPVTEISISK